MQIVPFHTTNKESHHKNKVVSIIGCGATAVAFVYSYLQMAANGNDLPKMLYIFEKRDRFGPGAAYESDLATNLLNTKTGYITPFHDRPGDFYNWLKVNELDWRSRYSSLILDEHSYAPRPLFGEYLQGQMDRLVKNAADLGIAIIKFNAEAKDLLRSGSGYIIKTDCGSIQCDFVFFLCGSLSRATRTDELESKRVLASPYPVSRLTDVIPERGSVGIIGARLSCIDAVIGLIEQGHRGPINIHSRSGYFPSVRGTQNRITPKVLTLEGLDALIQKKGKLNLLDLWGMVREEIALQGGAETGGDFQLPLPPRDLVAFLREEITKASGERVWQAVLYSTNAIIDRLWASLREDHRTEFISRYLSVFMAYRVSIPVENAQKILRYLQSGQLKFLAGAFDIGFERSGKPVVTMHDQSGAAISYDYVVNAMGTTRAASATGSVLVNNLFERGIMSPHNLGGIAVDTDSYCVIEAGGLVNSQLRAVGELTAGAFFFTSALDINVRHARNCVTQFARALTMRDLAAPAFAKDTAGPAPKPATAFPRWSPGAFFFTSALDINVRHARNCVTQFARALTMRDLAAPAFAKDTAGPAPKPATAFPRWSPRSADRQASLERRRRQATSGVVPAKIAAAFTLSELAVLSVIGRQCQRGEACTLPLDALAALAGCSRSSVKNALREARLRGLLLLARERRIPGRRSITNVITVVARDWLAWLRLRGWGGGKNLPATNNKVFYSARNGAPEPPDRRAERLRRNFIQERPAPNSTVRD